MNKIDFYGKIVKVERSDIMNTFIPKNYKSKLSIYETQTSIGIFKRIFEERLCKYLNLKRVSAPLFVKSKSGLNDDLNGIERPVSFTTKSDPNELQIVHSLAKWKRLALHEYEFGYGEGLYTDMNAIRRDEDMDNIHSIYVDQWDWEKVIKETDRTEDYLKETVINICLAIHEASVELQKLFPKLDYVFPKEVTFVDSYSLEKMYPNNTSKERENMFVKEHGTTFLMKIGGKLASGEPHDGRAPDYDDWDLNGDILVYNPVLDSAFEISSMGIRVNKESLLKQLTERNKLERLELEFHKMLMNDELPLTIGGGIGQSRLSMLLLEKAHIGEVQVSVWDQETKEACKKAGIKLL